jgi:hypothetical protein
MLKSLGIQKNVHLNNPAVKTSLDDSGFQNMFAIPGLGLDSNTQNIASNGIGTMVGGYSSLSLMLFIKDNKTGTIITSATNNDMAGVFLPIATNPTSGTGNLDVTSYLNYSCTPLGGGTPISGIVKTMAYNTTADPAITAPVRTCSNPRIPTALNIGLGRGWTDHEQNSAHPIGKIPFVGSVIFNQPIQALQPNSNFLLQIYVANKVDGGTITLTPTDMQHVYSKFTIDPSNPNKLNWSLPPGASTSDPGDPVVFGNVTWPTDMEAMFYCSMIVTLQDGSWGNANVQSTLTADDDPLDGTLEIMPIGFIWHCLGENTVITMANGTTKLIQDVIAGDTVVSGQDNETSVVEWTNKGHHIGRVLKIKGEGGLEIITSHHHIFFTNEGPIVASELSNKHELMTTEGLTKIDRIEMLDHYDKMLYNLATVKYSNPNESNGVMGSFIANGIKVGDVNAQKAHRYLQKLDKEWIKQQVPEYFHQDIKSFILDNKLKN